MFGSMKRDDAPAWLHPNLRSNNVNFAFLAVTATIHPVPAYQVPETSDAHHDGHNRLMRNANVD